MHSLRRRRFARILFALAGLTFLACNSSTDPGGGGEPYAVIRTFAGTGQAGLGTDGIAPADAQLYLPQDLEFGPDGRPYILDWNNHRVRVVEAGLVQTLIGTGELGDANAGIATEIGLNHPTHVSFDLDGHLILTAWHNSKVMRMDLSTNWIEPICGDGTRDFRGDGGPAAGAWLDLPSSTVCDAQGRMYISDQANQRIRMIDASGVISTLVGNGDPGFSGDGGPAVAAQISSPIGQAAAPAGRIFVQADGTLYIADTGNNRVRRVDPSGIIETVAGNGTFAFGGDDGPATDAALKWPADVAMDSQGNLYIADTRNSCVRRVDTSGNITTFAGRGGQSGYDGDGGAPAEALLNRPYGVAVDANDNVFIADTHNHRIRVVYK